VYLSGEKFVTNTDKNVPAELNWKILPIEDRTYRFPSFAIAHPVKRDDVNELLTTLSNIVEYEAVDILYLIICCPQLVIHK
jgi:hypothetical protein